MTLSEFGKCFGKTMPPHNFINSNCSACIPSGT